MHRVLPLIAGVFLLLTAPNAFAQSQASDTAWDYAADRGLTGSANPGDTVTRGQLLKAMVDDVYARDRGRGCFRNLTSPPDNRFTNLFPDVTVTHSMAEDVCIGMFVGIVDFQRDGNFRTSDAVTSAEAAKVIAKSYGIAPFLGLMPKQNVPWYEPYRYALARRNAIPESAKLMSHELTWGELTQILYAVRKERPSEGARYRAQAPEPAIVPQKTVAVSTPYVMDRRSISRRTTVALAPTTSAEPKKIPSRPRTAVKPLGLTRL